MIRGGAQILKSRSVMSREYEKRKVMGLGVRESKEVEDQYEHSKNKES